VARTVRRDRLLRVLDVLAVKRSMAGLDLGGALCATSVDVLDVPGAGITIQRPGGDPQCVATSNAHMASLHELERTLGEGPCVEAFTTGRATSAPDLGRVSSTRWPAFTAGALRTEARACFGYPLQVGDERIGALNLYAIRAGPLSTDQHEDAVVVAEVVTHALLLASAEGLTGELLGDAHSDLAVHQATGMIAVQLSVGVSDALARLRARAFVEERSINDVAADVIARRLRFER
jgi:transcriptional regulator with GAF, ATPase, and Fis domain